MANTLTFFTNPKSRASVTRWMLEETGLPYETQVLEYGTTMKAPAYRAVNPMGKVPAITHGDVVVTENAAICMYLAELAPEKKLAPAFGTPARGPYYRWIAFLSPLEQLMMFKATKAQMPEPGMAGFGTEADALDTLEGALAGRAHLAGDHFTACDLLVAAYVGWFVEFKLLEARPAFKEFAQRHAERPAAKRARELDAALEKK